MEGDTELIVQNAIYCVAIIGNAKNEYELVDMALPETRSKNLKTHGMQFCGVIAICTDGLPRVSFEIELPESTRSALCHAFLARVEAGIAQFERSMATVN